MTTNGAHAFAAGEQTYNQIKKDCEGHPPIGSEFSGLWVRSEACHGIAIIPSIHYWWVSHVTVCNTSLNTYYSWRRELSLLSLKHCLNGSVHTDRYEASKECTSTEYVLDRNGRPNDVLSCARPRHESMIAHIRAFIDKGHDRKDVWEQFQRLARMVEESREKLPTLEMLDASKEATRALNLKLIKASDTPNDKRATRLKKDLFIFDYLLCVMICDFHRNNGLYSTLPVKYVLSHALFSEISPSVIMGSYFDITRDGKLDNNAKLDRLKKEMVANIGPQHK